MRVVFDYAAGPGLAARLAALPGLDIIVAPQSEYGEVMRNADVLWHVLRPCTAETIAGAPRLQLIQKIGVGVNTIDLAAARARGIPVCNLPGTNSRAVAEMTLLLMLAALRRLPQFDAALRAGQWLAPPAIQDQLGEIGGKTVGLVGYGAVARILAPVLGALGCEVLYTSLTSKPDVAATHVPLPVLLATSDIVSLHLPLTPQTTHMIDDAALACMKPGAILVNTARGGLIDPVALAAALRHGPLAAAALDVFTEEPSNPADPLFQLPNVVVAPHVAWLTTGTFDRSFSIAAENCRRLAAGEELLHRVQ